jgi:glycosyltransferase involved in cell wall biosynthesis
MAEVKTSAPLVSVGMPVFNVEKTILEAVESICYQTFTDWELLVIDDGSTDGTGELLARISDPRVRVITHHENVGLGQRLNEAVAQARGEYFARLDGDDISYPERLQMQLDYVRAHPNVDVAGCWMILLDDERRPFGAWRPPEQHAAIARRPYHSILLAHPTYFGRREWFVKNPYPPEFVRMQDQILLMHTARHSTFANLQRTLVGYHQPALDVGTALRRRMTAIANAARFFIRKKQYANVARNVLSNSAMAVLEFVAEITRLRHRLLIHRVRPLSAREEAEWQNVWSMVAEAVRSGESLRRAGTV